MNRSRLVRALAVSLAAALALASISVGAAPAAADASVVKSFTDTFDAEVVTADAKTDGAWYPDRYRPAVFESTVFDRGTRLRVAVSAADSAASRPSQYSSTFYNTQGRKFDLGNGVGTYVSGDLYIGSDFESQERRADLWATTNDVNGDVSGYPIFGFKNGEGFRVFTQDVDQDASNGELGGWAPIGLPDGFEYGTWHNLRIELTDSAYLFYLDGELVFTDTVTYGSVKFADMMLQAYNYGQSYATYWDNVSAGPIVPVPAPDTTAPVTSLSVVSSVAGKAQLTLSATDADSGVASTHYRIDGGEWAEGTSVTLQSLGAHTVEFYSVDNEGNAEEPQSVSVNVWGTSALTISAPTTAKWNGSASVKVSVGSTTGQVSVAALDGKVVVIDKLVGPDWVKVADVAVDGAGQGVGVVPGLTTTTRIRARLAEQAPLTAASTGTLTIKPRVWMSQPAVSSKLVGKGKPLAVSVQLKGRHRAGSYPVALVFERYERRANGSMGWVKRLNLKARAHDYSDYTRCSATVRLRAAGKWRVRAVHAEDSKNALTTSRMRTFSVK